MPALMTISRAAAPTWSGSPGQTLAPDEIIRVALTRKAVRAITHS